MKGASAWLVRVILQAGLKSKNSPAAETSTEACLVELQTQEQPQQASALGVGCWVPGHRI